MTTSRSLRALAVALAVGAAATTPLEAQTVMARTPNLQGVWTAPTGVIQFNFLHRFSISDAPLRKITNTPTFHVVTGVAERVMVGFTYGSNSALVPAYPNEWEFFARARPLWQQAGAPFDLAVQGGYNVASESVDGELTLARAFGPLRLLGAARAFSAGFDGEDARFAVAGGVSLGLTPNISIAGDFGTLLDKEDGEKEVWSAGLQMGVPYAPHSFSIHVSNVGTASLEGASRGSRTRWGFEYTVPITLSRLTSGGPSGSREAGPAAMSAEFENARATGDTLEVDILNLAFTNQEIRIAPGTTVVWVNRDPLQHTVTSTDGQFDSGLIDPQGRYALTFPTAGTFPYTCTPHPFMTGTVVVGGGMEGEGRR